MCVRACGMHVCVCARVRSSDYRQFGTAFWVGLGVCVIQKFSKVSAQVHLLSHPPGTAFLARAWCLRMSCADGDQKFSEVSILVHLLYVVPVENFLRMCGDDHLEYHAVREREGARERVWGAGVRALRAVRGRGTMGRRRGALTHATATRRIVVLLLGHGKSARVCELAQIKKNIRVFFMIQNAWR